MDTLKEISLTNFPFVKVTVILAVPLLMPFIEKFILSSVLDMSEIVTEVLSEVISILKLSSFLAPPRLYIVHIATVFPTSTF